MPQTKTLDELRDKFVAADSQRKAATELAMSTGLSSDWDAAERRAAESETAKQKYEDAKPSTLDELGQEVLAAVVAVLDAEADWSRIHGGSESTPEERRLALVNMNHTQAINERAVYAYCAAHKAAQTKPEGEGSEEHGDESTQDKA